MPIRLDIIRSLFRAGPKYPSRRPPSEWEGRPWKIMAGVPSNDPKPRRVSRRSPMTSKRGRNYYKGTGSGAMGRHTKWGGYVIDYAKVRTYVVPANLDSCPLKPYVSPLTRKFRNPMTPRRYANMLREGKTECRKALKDKAALLKQM